MPRQSLNGTAEEALALQAANEVPARFQGCWFHSSKNGRLELVEYSEPTFFSHSPGGWTGWGGHKTGDPILAAYVIEPPTSPDSVVRAPFIPGGDEDGFENGTPVPEWWLVLQNEDIDKLMIVEVFPQDNEKRIQTIRTSQEYVALRNTKVALLS
ncbi:hypothetical protein [Gimesia sp.]|uniref:hypothetical protein n=1 Tax=Gimesia sp. TaxID=2024833 RepID=UPI0032EEBB7A